jgi:hypothetical protein
LDWNSTQFRPGGWWPRQKPEPPSELEAKIRGAAAEERDRLAAERLHKFEQYEAEQRRRIDEVKHRILKHRIQKELDARPVRIDYDGEPSN